MTTRKQQFLDSLYIAVVGSVVGALVDPNKTPNPDDLEFMVALSDEVASKVCADHMNSNDEESWLPGGG